MADDTFGRIATPQTQRKIIIVPGRGWRVPDHDEQLLAFCDLFAVLWADVSGHLRIRRTHDDDFTRRNVARSVCAYIEGVIYGMKQVALLEHRLGNVIFTDARVALLTEQWPELDDQGRVIERPSKLKTLPNLRFAYGAFAQSQNAEFVLDVGGSGWKALREANRVRDRLMHPKAAAGLRISDEEIEAVNAASAWFRSSFIDLLKKAILHRDHPRLQSIVHRLERQPAA